MGVWGGEAICLMYTIPGTLMIAFWISMSIVL